MIPESVAARLHQFYFNYMVEDELYEQLSTVLMGKIEEYWNSGKDEETQESYDELTDLGIHIIKQYITERDSKKTDK